MVLSRTELALINFDGLVRTTDLNRAAFQKEEHGFSAIHALVCHCVATEAIFSFDSVGWFAEHNSNTTQKQKMQKQNSNTLC
jgi:hypothetical protein